MRESFTTMSLFTKLGSWSVRRRTNRVFPKPPRLDETTRTQSLQRIQSIAFRCPFQWVHIQYLILFYIGKAIVMIILSEVKKNVESVQIIFRA